MKQTDIVFEKYASFWDKHKNTLLAGGIGALLSGGIGAAAAGVDPEDTPSQKLWKRLKTGLVAGTLGGLATGGTAHLLKATGADKAISKGVNKVVDTVKGKSDNSNGGKPGQKAKEDKGLISELTDSAGVGTTIGAAGGGAGGTALGVRLGGKAKYRTSEEYKNNIEALNATRDKVRQITARIAGTEASKKALTDAFDAKYNIGESTLKQPGGREAVIQNRDKLIRNNNSVWDFKNLTYTPDPELMKHIKATGHVDKALENINKELAKEGLPADKSDKLNKSKERVGKRLEELKKLRTEAETRISKSNDAVADAMQADYKKLQQNLASENALLKNLKLNPHGQKVLDNIDIKLADEMTGKLNAEMKGGNNTRPIRNRILGGLLGLSGGAGIGTVGGAFADRAIVNRYNERKNKNN